MAVAANLEGAVRVSFSCGEHVGFCSCATCGQWAYCHGRNAESRVCLDCFEFRHDCSFPNYRRRHR